MEDVVKLGELVKPMDEKKGFFANLMSNPLFSAGAGVAGLGMGVAVCRTGALHGIAFLQRRYTVSLEIPSKDRSYHWVLQWIKAHSNRQLNMPGMPRTQHLGVETTFRQHENGSVSTNFDYVPSPGRHFISYKRSYIQIVREREKNMVDLNSGMPWETVTLTAVGRSHAIFDDLLAEAKNMAMKKEEGKTVIYSSMGPEWRPFGRPRRRRPLHSVILKAGIAEKLLDDVQEFSRSQKWYVDRGIPYRRGYLLHGPPGCGKSSYIMALAGQLEYNICILNLNERGLTDDKLNVLLSVAPPRSIILLEDVDAAFAQREAQEKNYSVTFSGLLNCLDGVASTEERIIFMTTNHIDRLDPALIRPGRVDVQHLIGPADAGQVYAMFKRFYPESTAQADVFQHACEGLDLSMAHLQGIFLLHKDSPTAALDFIIEHKQQQEQDSSGEQLRKAQATAEKLI